MPLYIYPLPGKWDTLFQAFTQRPDLKFIVVVNPNSGPGSGNTPDSNYGPAIAKLNTYANVVCIGYVRTGYTTKTLAAVKAEVDQYAAWSTGSNTWRMQGIFFDEAPYDYNAGQVEYMKQIDAYVKNNAGLKGARTVVHNPGWTADPAYHNANTDFTFVFEHDYQNWVDERRAAVSALPADRNKYGLMFNSVPRYSTPQQMKDFTNSLTPLAKYIFATSLTVDFYESFASDWLAWVASVPA
jgi:hypothetical protein